VAYPDPKIVTVAAPTNEINATRPLPSGSARSTARAQPCVVIHGGGQHPAKPLKKRYSDEDIDRLLRIAWWNWPVDVINEYVRTIWTGTPVELEKAAKDAGLLNQQALRRTASAEPRRTQAAEASDATSSANTSAALFQS